MGGDKTQSELESNKVHLQGGLGSMASLVLVQV